jgi:hypothetical protein
VCATNKNLDSKWRNFPNLLKAEGIALVPSDSKVQRHHFDLESYPHTIENFGQWLPIKNRTLIRVEPVVVNPFQYQERIQNKYESIVVISPNELKGPRNLYWKSGYIDFEKIENISSDNRTGIALINENKFSFVPGSNYKLRKKVIDGFIENKLPLNLAGMNWDNGYAWHFRKQASALRTAIKNHQGVALSQTQFRLKVESPWINYAGRVESAQAFLAKSKFAIVIENDSTYVSEKLLNALIAGCIPIYSGPPLSIYGIPSEVALNVGKQPNEFVSAYLDTPILELEKVRRLGQNWIHSEDARKRWSVTEGFGRLIDIIKLRTS